MSKQMIVIVAVVLLAIIGAGAYMLMGKNDSNSLPSTSSNSDDSSGVFGSIQEAISKSVSLQCEYTDESGMKTTAYISGGSVRADMTGGAEASSVIMKDKKM